MRIFSKWIWAIWIVALYPNRKYALRHEYKNQWTKQKNIEIKKKIQSKLHNYVHIFRNSFKWMCSDFAPNYNKKEDEIKKCTAHKLIYTHRKRSR